MKFSEFLLEIAAEVMGILVIIFLVLLPLTGVLWCLKSIAKMIGVL